MLQGAGAWSDATAVRWLQVCCSGSVHEPFLLAAAGWNADILGQWPFIIAIWAASAHIFWQILYVDLQSGGDCMAKFVSNRYYGALLFGGIVASKLA